MRRHFRLASAAVTILFLMTVTGLAYVYRHTPRTQPKKLPQPLSSEIARETRPLVHTGIASYALLYVESDLKNSTIWSASPDSPLAQRESVLELSHAEGYPPKASLSPNGNYLAYTFLAGGNSPAFKGSLWVVGLTDRIPRLIDTDVDYGWAPKWSNDGASFVYVKKVRLSSETQYRNDLYVAGVNGGTNLLFSDQSALEVVPVGWNLDGKHVYVDRIAEAGDSLYEIESGSGKARFISHLSQTAAWNLSLSPDGKKIVGSIRAEQEAAAYSVVAVSVDTGKTDTIVEGAPNNYTPIWHPKKAAITTDIPVGDERGRSEVVDVGMPRTKDRVAPSRSVINLDGQRFNRDKSVPVSWSPDGQWLALETYHQSSTDLTLTRASDGNTSVASSRQWLEFIGWLKAR